MRIDADSGEREFGHVAAADDHRARGAQARDRRSVRARRGLVAQDLRAGRGDLARDVEEILDRHRQPGKRRRHHPVLAQPVGGLGGEQRALGVHLGEGAAALAAGVGDTRERFLDEPAARGLAVGEVARERRDRTEYGVGYVPA